LNVRGSELKIPDSNFLADGVPKVFNATSSKASYGIKILAIIIVRTKGLIA